MRNVDYDPGPKLETNIKIASAGDRTRVACVIGGHSTLRAIKTAYTRVKDPGSLSQIPDPDFQPSRILDPKQQQKRGVKKN